MVTLEYQQRSTGVYPIAEASPALAQVLFCRATPAAAVRPPHSSRTIVLPHELQLSPLHRDHREVIASWDGGMAAHLPFCLCMVRKGLHGPAAWVPCRHSAGWNEAG